MERQEIGFANNHKFIAKVQMMPMLWDMKCSDYRQPRVAKNFEWERIGQAFKLTGAQALQKWIYLKEKYKREAAKQDSRWPFLNKLKFLDSNPRRTYKNDGYFEKDVEQSIQKFDIISRKTISNTNLNQLLNKTPFLHNNQVQKLNVHHENDLITPIVVSISTTTNNSNNSNSKIKSEKLSPTTVQMSDTWQQSTNDNDNNILMDITDNGFAPDDSTLPPNDYKNRCRAFAKYLGEELCLMNDVTGDALITDMLKIIVEEKSKKSF